MTNPEIIHAYCALTKSLTIRLRGEEILRLTGINAKQAKLILSAVEDAFEAGQRLN